MRVALSVATVPGFFVGAVNRDIAVVVEWTDAENIGVRGKIFGNDFGNQESAVVRRGIPNGLRVDYNIISVEQVGVVALEIFRSALLDDPSGETVDVSWLGDKSTRTYPEDDADSFLGKRNNDNGSVAGPIQLGEVDGTEGRLQCKSWHVEIQSRELKETMA